MSSSTKRSFRKLYFQIVNNSLAIVSLFNATSQQSITSFTMKLNFLLAAALVAAPVLAASSTTETHTSTQYVLLRPGIPPSY
jgi:hypothetical protein